MNVMIMIIAFAVALASVAWLTARMRRPRRAREIADDAETRELYGRYLADVEALTHAYLLQAPSDQEWLAKIRPPALGVVGVAAFLAPSLSGHAHVSVWWVLLLAAVIFGVVAGKMIGSGS